MLESMKPFVLAGVLLPVICSERPTGPGSLPTPAISAATLTSISAAGFPIMTFDAGTPEFTISKIEVPGNGAPDVVTKVSQVVYAVP